MTRLALCDLNVRFGSEADICAAKGHVRFTPNSDTKSGHRRNVMSAFPPKADMCGANCHVCFGPKADIAGLLDHLVGTAEKRDWEGDSERLCGFEIEGQFNLRCLHDW